MINSKNMLGGRYVGEGTYGCIFRPNLPCPGYSQNEKYVSKVINNDSETIKDEFKNIDDKFKISTIDPDSDYFVVPIHQCKIDDITSNDLKPSNEILAKRPNHRGCPDKQIPLHLQNKITNGSENDKRNGISVLNQYKTQLILPYGGMDIENTRKSDTTDSKPNIDSIWEQHLNLLKGLVLLNENNIIHRDIKSANILLHEDKMRFIDMGLSIKMDEDFSDFQATNYLYWPADYMSSSNAYIKKVLNINAFDSRTEKITKILKGLFTDHTRHINDESIISVYEKYGKYGWIIDSDHKSILIKSLSSFMIRFIADKTHSENDVVSRIKNTFDVFSVGAFLCDELKRLPDNNKNYRDSLTMLAQKMTSFDPFERPLPIEAFRLYIKIVKKDILDSSEHYLLNSHIEEVDTF